MRVAHYSKMEQFLKYVFQYISYKFLQVLFFDLAKYNHEKKNPNVMTGTFSLNLLKISDFLRLYDEFVCLSQLEVFIVSRSAGHVSKLYTTFKRKLHLYSKSHSVKCSKHNRKHSIIEHNSWNYKSNSYKNTINQLYF